MKVSWIVVSSEEALFSTNHLQAFEQLLSDVYFLESLKISNMKIFNVLIYWFVKMTAFYVL